MSLIVSSGTESKIVQKVTFDCAKSNAPCSLLETRIFSHNLTAKKLKH